jgi:hypothetical protein
MIANIRRLPEALKMSAIAIEDLYKELNRASSGGDRPDQGIA